MGNGGRSSPPVHDYINGYYTMKHFYKGENLTVAAIAERTNRSFDATYGRLKRGTLPQTHYSTRPKRYMLECGHGNESYCPHRGHCRVCGARVKYTKR